MRIVHVSSLDSHGGAFRGAAWLHQALQEQGVDSHMLVARKHTQDPSVHLASPLLMSRLQHVWSKICEARALRAYPNAQFEAGFSPAVISANLRPAFRKLRPDIVHVHWIGFGFVRPEDIGLWSYPIVWTLRDMWAFTGGCHYTGGCERYLDRCGACPQLGSTVEQDLSRDLWLRKHRHWADADITLVGVSHWLADCARRSSLLRRFPIHVIPNLVNTVSFRPTAKADARSQLGLPPNRPIVLFGAYNAVTDPRKGFRYLVQAFEHLVSTNLVPDMYLAVFGADGPPDHTSLRVPNRFFGTIADDRVLATLYNAADVMVVPSIQDNFPKTPVEAMACGTPVVSFDSTGLKDIVEHQQSGYRARCYDPLDLAEGIRWVLSDPDRLAALGEAAVARVKENFTMERVARRYADLYESILARRAAA